MKKKNGSEMDEDDSSYLNVNNTNIKKKKAIKLYFSFFNLVSENTFYSFDNEEYKKLYPPLYNFNDLNAYKKLFENCIFTVKQKTILLKFLRSIYFIDRLDNYNYLKTERQLTTGEYKNLLLSNTIIDKNFSDTLQTQSNIEIPIEIVKNLTNKYHLINQINLVILLYIGELKIFPKQLKKQDINSIKNFYKEIIIGIRFITNFFI